MDRFTIIVVQHLNGGYDNKYSFSMIQMSVLILEKILEVNYDLKDMNVLIKVKMCF